MLVGHSLASYKERVYLIHINGNGMIMNFYTNVKVTIGVVALGAAFIFLSASGKFEYKKHGDNTEVLLSVDVNK